MHTDTTAPFVRVERGDCRHVLTTLASESVQCCITSPPYFGLRDYGHDGQIGQEETPEAFVSAMVAVFREVRRVLKPDGTLWLNLGDSYSRSPAKGGSGPGGKNEQRWGYGAAQSAKIGSSDGTVGRGDRPGTRSGGLGEKQLIGIPWRVALALQADGWYLRQDIIWHKPNPMPESVTDRCTKSHEYIFLLSKSPHYYYDHEAIKEPMAESSVSRLSQDIESQAGSDRVPSKTNGPMKAVGRGGKNAFRGQGAEREGETGPANRDGREMKDVGASGMRNKRSVWTVATMPYRGAHFATYPAALITPCILAGTKTGDVVLDPFGGSGTTGMVAYENGRSAVLIELNQDYAKLIDERLTTTGGLALTG